MSKLHELILFLSLSIDHAAHNQDPVGHYHDIIAYQEMVEAVAKWVDDNDTGSTDPDVVMVGTSDHECGGLTLALQRPEDKSAFYGWYPEPVLAATHTTEYLAADFLKATANQTDDEKRTYMTETIIKKGLGVTDANNDEIQRALDLAKVSDSGLSMNIWLASIISWRAQIGWSTTGHSGVDVNLYYHEAPRYNKTRASRLEQFKGNHENTWVGNWTVGWLGLDNMQNITDTLNNGSYSWTQNHQDLTNFTTGLPKYHGGPARVVPALPAASKRANIGYSYNDNLHYLRDFSAQSHRAARRAPEL